MQYMLLIHGDETAEPEMSEADLNQRMQAYMAYTQELRDSGALVAGDRLHPTAAATTVRVRDGQTLTTDGPFAETKEQLGGYYIIEAESLDDALGWAAKIPGAVDGSIEVRPVFSMAAMEAGA